MLEIARCSIHPGDMLGEEHHTLNICGYKAVSDTHDKIGTIHDFVYDEQGKIRFLVVDSGFWIFGKKVLVPIGRADIRDEQREVVLRDLTKTQVESMPAFDETVPISEQYESELMECYYPGMMKTDSVEKAVLYQESEEFELPERLRLVEERLQVNKHREKAGDVTLRKHVETHQESVDVPLEEERVIIETHPVTDVEFVTGEEVHMTGEETIHIPVYKEELDVSKRPVITEEVTVRKEKRTRTRHVSEQVRQEKLDIEKTGTVETENIMKEEPIRD